MADVEAAGDLAGAVGDVEVDPGDEAGARPGADRDVRAEVDAPAVDRRRVGVRVAAAGDLADVLAPLEPEVLGGRGQRRPEPGRVREELGQAVQAPQRVEDVGRAAERAVLAADARASGVKRSARASAAARSTASRTLPGAASSAAGAASASGRRPSASAAERRAIVRPACAASSRSSSTARSSSSRWARTASSSSSQRRVGGEPLVRGVGARRRARARPAGGARPGAPRRGRARLGALELAGQALGAGRGLLALGLGRLAAAAGGLGLAARSSTRASSRSARSSRAPAARAASSAVRSRASRRDSGTWRAEELLPAPEDVDDVVGVRPVLAAQPVLRPRDLAGEHDPAVEVAEVVGLLDEQLGLVQAPVGGQRGRARRPGDVAPVAVGAPGRRRRRPPRPWRPRPGRARRPACRPGGGCACPSPGEARGRAARRARPGRPRRYTFQPDERASSRRPSHSSVAAGRAAALRRGRRGGRGRSRAGPAERPRRDVELRRPASRCGSSSSARLFAVASRTVQRRQVPAALDHPQDRGVVVDAVRRRGRGGA